VVEDFEVGRGVIRLENNFECVEIICVKIFVQFCVFSTIKGRGVPMDEGNSTFI
jgi:hypothetical protein